MLRPGAARSCAPRTLMAWPGMALKPPRRRSRTGARSGAGRPAGIAGAAKLGISSIVGADDRHDNAIEVMGVSFDAN